MAQPRIVTDVEIKKARPKEKTYKILLGRGFWLDVAPTGVKSWRQSVRHNGKQHLVTLGRYPDLSLKEASAKADEQRLIARLKPKPSEDEKKLNSRKNTEIFKEVARQYLSSHKATWSKVHFDDVCRLISEMCNGFKATDGMGFGHIPIGVLSKKDVLVITDGALNRGAHIVVLRPAI